ncbi:cilia- and flagella-associated protein 206-like [Symsagittifera roscoffensis]|uniref:cilia- and flagella-associated protein 206-like n=1 Tax=Symsagittifera roscoffensis TaxID=84072 RepID=UPI00307C5D60
MSRAQAESVIKNIIREIAQECASKGQAVSETLVAFLVKAVVLDPANNFNVDRTLTKDDVHKLIQICVSRILDSRSPSLDTIKMQVYFDMNYTTRQDFLDEHRRVLDARMQPVIREITDSRARTREELEALYRKIVSAILLRSGLGSPTDIAVVREATAALQSVFPQAELGTFMNLTKRDKERQLNELTLIVTGIRLFNKDCGKGGEGIDDLPAILNEAIPATMKNVDAAMGDSSRVACTYTAVIERIHQGLLKEGPPLQLIKDSLVNSRQHQQFLNILRDDVIGCAGHIEALQNQLAQRLEQLQATVQARTAVPTAQVYPQFINLAHIWTGFQDEMVLLSVLSNIMNSLEPFTQNHREIFTEEILSPLVDLNEVKSDEQRQKELLGSSQPQQSTGDQDGDAEGGESGAGVGGARIDPNAFTEFEWIFPETTKNFEKLPLQYRGFCGWYLVKYDRFLMPAVPSIGVLFYNDKYYAFSSKEAAYEFAADPVNYIFMVAEAAKKSPELIQLLELHQQFATITPYSSSQKGGAGGMIEKPQTKADAGCQTDTHILEANLVKDYEWNEWELRRKAIKLANLRTKLTKSMQTNLSNMRRDNVSQVYLPKENTTQTKKEGGSSVPKPQTYLYGLRGGMEDETRMQKVDLTLDTMVDTRTASGIHVK